MIGFNTYKTRWGRGALVFSHKGLAYTVFPQENDLQLEEEIAKRFGVLKYNEHLGQDLSYSLGLYFNGERIQFDYQLDYGRSSEFEKLVYEHLKAVPYGKVINYKELAKRCGHPKAARAVGNALAKNPMPVVIPCHRVLKSDGSIGGWSGKRGWKERLLAIEGVRWE